MGLEKLNELKSKMAAVKAEMAREGKQAFQEACDEVFQAHPKLESFSWVQYTPYFNDGEPCEFHVYEDLAKMVFEGKDLEYVWVNHRGEAVVEGVEDVEDKDGLVAAAEAAIKVTSFLAGNGEIALDAFGDHAKVTVSRDGIDVEHCDHD